MNTGKETIDYFEELLKCLTDDTNFDAKSQNQPIALLLLDINIPIVSGIDVLVRVKDVYKKTNQTIIKRLVEQDQKEHHIIRPLISYVS